MNFRKSSELRFAINSFFNLNHPKSSFKFSLLLNSTKSICFSPLLFMSLDFDLVKKICINKFVIHDLWWQFKCGNVIISFATYYMRRPSILPFLYLFVSIFFQIIYLYIICLFIIELTLFFLWKISSHYQSQSSYIYIIFSYVLYYVKFIFKMEGIYTL